MQVQSGNVQIGMALVDSDGPNPAWAQSMEAEASRLWKKFFSTGNPSSIHISLPLEWRNFFIVLLLSPGNFSWGKHLLSSKVTSGLVNYDSNCVELAIPSSCPEHNFDCLTVVEEEG